MTYKSKKGGKSMTNPIQQYQLSINLHGKWVKWPLAWVVKGHKANKEHEIGQR